MFKWLIKFFGEHRTVDQVLEPFSSITKDLDAVQQCQEADSMRHHKLASHHDQVGRESHAESLRADSVARKLREVFDFE